MALLCLGLSHHTAPVALRERAAFPPAALTAALARFGCGHDGRPAGLTELVILSTCSRTELYAVQSGDGADFEPLVAFFAETRGLAQEVLAPCLYAHHGAAAAQHLARVAAGLDSLVLGEPQVLGQVGDAYQQALALGAAGAQLAALFQAALRAGRRARAETGIGREAASLGAAAVRLAAQAVPNLAASRVLVIGAGEMAELTVQALRARGATQITVLNRTLARAAELAGRWSAQAETFERLSECLPAADIVLSSTDAPHLLVTRAQLAEAMAQRPKQPLVAIDLAVPRDIDPEAATLPNVRVFDLDGLQAHLAGSQTRRQQAVPAVEAIVAAEVAAFQAWQQQQDIAPLLAELRARADSIRAAEVERTLRRLPDLSPDEKQHVEALAEALVNKLLHAPTTRLREDAGYAAALRQLFALHD